jgi:hypothetical protein
MHFEPQMATHGRQRIDERGCLLRLPRRLTCGKLGGGELVSQEQDATEAAAQARSRALKRAGTPGALRVEAEGGTRCCAGALERPSSDIPGADLEHRNGVVGAEEGERVALA